MEKPKIPVNLILEKMAEESYQLLISDIVMPGKNGLELLKLVKAQWPLTKAVMMTAYASTDTAMKAIRLGALDYIPKPFTPAELRTTVEKALSGELKEIETSEAEREAINIIDIDVPFDADEVAEELERRGVVNLGRDQGLGPGVPVDPDSETGQRGYDSYILLDPDGWALQISK